MGYFGVLTHRAVLCLLFAAGLSACGGGGGGAAAPGTPDPATPILESIIYIEVNPFFPASLAKGETRQFYATGYRVNGGSVDLTSTATWTSTASSVVSVNASGLATAAGVGSANVTASLGGASGYASQTVTAAKVVALAVTPADPTTMAGVTTQFSATATYSDASVGDITNSVTWYSSDSLIASPDWQGKVLAVAPGSATITARWSGMYPATPISATSILTVDKYSISGKTSLLPAGSSIVLQNNGTDSLTISSDGNFVFPAGLALGGSYSVTVSSQLAAPAHPCTVVDGSGVISNYVSEVQVICGMAVGTLAGTNTASGFVDGTGSAARFNQPEGVAIDATGNVYVADTYNFRIRKITPAGVVATFAGSGTAGSANGTGTAASFDRPGGVAVDSAGNVYVADVLNHTIRKITPGGVVTTLAGTAGQFGAANGTGAAARFDWPQDVAVDAGGNVYVADSGNYLIRKITPAGVVTTLAGSGSLGSANGTGTAASFYRPMGLDVDSAGNVYVADTNNYLIRKITPAGVVTTLAGSGVSGYADGTGTAASFAAPYDVTVDGSGNLYVADLYNGYIRMITPAGEVTTLAGAGPNGSGHDGPASTAMLFHPRSVDTDASGNWYVLTGSVVRKITP